jgi:hypothetical protein
VTTWWRQQPGRWAILKRKYVIELGSGDVICFEVPGSYPDHEHRRCSRLPVRVDMRTYVYICIQWLYIYRTSTYHQCNSAEIVCLRTTKSTFQLHNIHKTCCIYIYILCISAHPRPQPRRGYGPVSSGKLIYRCWTGNNTKVSTVNKGKGKAISLKTWTGPEGSRRLRLTDFKTIGIWSW